MNVRELANFTCCQRQRNNSSLSNDNLMPSALQHLSFGEGKKDE